MWYCGVRWFSGWYLYSCFWDVDHLQTKDNLQNETKNSIKCYSNIGHHDLWLTCGLLKFLWTVLFKLNFLVHILYRPVRIKIPLYPSIKTTERLHALCVYLFLLLNFLFLSHKWCPKRQSKPVNLSSCQHYLHIHTLFSTQFNIKHTHILAGSHLSKQTFKSLQKYKILSICISFFYLHFEMAEIIPNWHESPMSRSGATLNFREPFKPPALTSLPMMAACH